MQKTTTILAIIGIVLIAATLIGITYAQIITPTPNATAEPSYVNGKPNISAPYCYNVTGVVPPNCNYGLANGYSTVPQRCPGYADQQGFSKYPYGGMMDGRRMMDGNAWTWLVEPASSTPSFVFYVIHSVGVGL